MDSVTAIPTDAAARRRATPAQIVLRILLGLIALVFLAWAILYITKGRFLKHRFERMVGKSIGRDVRVAGDFQLFLNPIDIKFLAEGLTISNPAWASKDHLFAARLINTSIPLFPLLFGTRRADWLQLVGGDVDLEWDAAHRTNTWTFGKSSGKPFEMPVIRRAAIDGTTLRYIDPKMQLKTDIRFATFRAADNRFQNEIRFTGDGAMRGNPFVLRGSLNSPNETLAGWRNRLVLNARSGGTHMDVTGTLPGATELNGSDLRIAVRGPNMADLFAFIGVAVPDSRAWRMTSALTKQGPEWRFTGMKGIIGASDLAGKMTITMIEPRLRIDADLASDTVDIVDAGAWVGYDPDRLAAQGNSGTIRRVNGTPRILPDAQLRIDALKAFDARVQYTVRRVRAPNLPISNIAMALTLDDRVLSFRPLSFDMAGGHLTSEIAINARGTPVRTSYDIRLSPTPMGKLLGGFGVAESGTTGVLKGRVQLVGFGDTVHESLASANGRIAIILPQGALWTRNVQLAELDVGTFVQKMFEEKLKSPVEINCGLIAFTVRGGIAAADPILIDTRKNVIVGRGGFSFRNESLDLALRADSKKISLFAGQTPVGVNGYFASPGINPISTALLARAGIGLGLAAVATPLGAILAFVDVGDAKATQCGPVLGGATASAQRTKNGKPRDDVGHGTTAKDEDGRSGSGERKQQRKKFLGIF